LGYPGGNTYRNLALQVGRVSKIETIKYARESRGTQIWERLRWRRPAKTENYRPDFSSEREPRLPSFLLTPGPRHNTVRQYK
jgi:hypothetical protein